MNHRQPVARKRRSVFLDNERFLSSYTQPRMVNAAQELMTQQDLSEEGFLGIQGVLLLNGIL